ncbi:MAG: hypothetical protein MK175_20090, partial [Pseudoalteromonas sp.]|uniref:hypothetical protein n=1 Tax=Pseudoalteromonas sp. TaxID=53249 RepID=UPI0025DBD596
RAIQSFEGTASRASDEASSGNIQAGSVGIGNTNMFKQDYSSSLAMGSSTFESGGILEKSFVNAQGETQSVIQQAQSSTVLSGQSSQTITDAAKSNYQQDITNGNESTRQVLESYGAQLNEDKASLTKLAAGLSTQIDNMSGKDAENSEGFKAMKQARDDINRQIEELDSQATTIETGIGGKGTLPGEALKLIGVRASMAESGVETSRDSTTESFQFAVSQTGEENIKLAERASELLKGTDQSSLADEATDGLRASNSNSVVTNESQMAKIQEGENASYQLAQMEENGNSISVANEDRIIGKLNETGNAKEILNALQTGNLSEQQTKDLNKAIQEVQVEDIARMGTVGATQRASFEENREKIEQKAIDDEATLTNQGFSRVNALKEEGETRVGDRNGEQDIPTREQVVAGYFNAVEKSKEVRSDTVDEGKEGVGNLNRQEDLASVFEDQLAIEQGNAGEEGAYGTTRSAKMDEDRSDINRKRFL